MEQPSKKRLLVFASGEKDGGGSGFKNLVESTYSGVLKAEVVGVISNIEDGGVARKALNLDIPFYYSPGETVQDYQTAVELFKPDFNALSGWLKLVKGLDPTKTINIHPGPLPVFGGKDFYGHFVHEAVVEAFRMGEITHSAVTMHYVTEKFDDGPIIFEYPVKIEDDDTPETLQKRVNGIEHAWQPYITNLVVTGQIAWDGKKVFIPNYVPLFIPHT